MKTTLIWMLLTLILFGISVTFTNAQTKTSNVVINGTRLSDQILSAIEMNFQVRIPDGKYWYDSRAGIWGMEGGPTLGLAQPGLNLGGPLSADASHGTTKVFINGRELHIYDVLTLQQIVYPYPVMQGRYWVDYYGNIGFEGGPALGNLVQAAQAKYGSGGGSKSAYDSGIGSVMSGDNGCTMFISGSQSAYSSKC